jgi:hypothetical protein
VPDGKFAAAARLAQAASAPAWPPRSPFKVVEVTKTTLKTAVEVALGVGVRVAVSVAVAVGDGVTVAVAVGVIVVVEVAVADPPPVGVADGVIVAVLVALAVGVAEEFCVAVDVAVAVGVRASVVVAVGVAVGVGVAVEVAVGEGPISPTPMSFTFCGLLAAASLNVSRPCLNLPFDGGVNVTETSQLFAGGIALAHPFEPRLKPLPLTLTTGADISTLLLLVRVTTCGLLRVPAGTLPKSSFGEDNPTWSLLLVPDRLSCALARPLKASKKAQIAITTPIARRDEITR